MAEVAADDRPLTFEDLVAWFDKGSKPKDQWRCGAEHEKFVFRLGSNEPVPYEPAPPENGGIKALLDGLRKGRDMKPGPQIPRQFSAPAGGPTTLTNGAAPGTSQGKTKDED